MLASICLEDTQYFAVSVICFIHNYTYGIKYNFLHKLMFTLFLIPQIVKQNLQWNNTISPFFWQFVCCVTSSSFVHPVQASMFSSKTSHVFHRAHFLMPSTICALKISMKSFAITVYNCLIKGLNLWSYWNDDLYFAWVTFSFAFTVSQFLVYKIKVIVLISRTHSLVIFSLLSKEYQYDGYMDVCVARHTSHKVLKMNT